MPKEGYESITVPDALNERIISFIDESQGLVTNKSQAMLQAWQIYENLFLSEKNPKPVRIGNKLIGHNQPPYVIAEVGINHNGDINTCKKLIDLAVETGCDAVKFQKRTIETVYSKEELDKPRESPWGTTNREQKHGLELGEEEYKEIDDYCKMKGITWFASPWDVESVDFLEKFDVPAYKIASASITDKDLLAKIKATKKPIILSTGMSTIEQIHSAVKFLGEENLIILHCTSTYPSADHEQNLNVIPKLRKYFNCPIGYSGHEPGVWPTIVAAAVGACVIERHITLDRAMYGSDQAASLEKKGIETINNIVKKIPLYKGDGIKKVMDSEVPIMGKLRRVNNL